MLSAWGTSRRVFCLEWCEPGVQWGWSVLWSVCRSSIVGTSGQSCWKLEWSYQGSCPKASWGLLKTRSVWDRNSTRSHYNLKAGWDWKDQVGDKSLSWSQRPPLSVLRSTCAHGLSASMNFLILFSNLIAFVSLLVEPAILKDPGLFMYAERIAWVTLTLILLSIWSKEEKGEKRWTFKLLTTFQVSSQAFPHKFLSLENGSKYSYPYFNTWWSWGLQSLNK